MSLLDRDTLQWLHAKGDLYARSGQHQRGLAYLLLANQIAPNNTAVLRTLVGVFTTCGDGQRALAALAHLNQLEGFDTAQLLLRSRALWVIGEQVEARNSFRDYVRRVRRPVDGQQGGAS